MPPEELTLILKLRDEATKQLKSVRGTVTAVGGAMAATGLKVGADWATATKTIVDGTGATGAPLKQLQTDFQAVAKHGANEAATAIADLNTHLGLTGPELQEVADLALKAGVDTSKFGAVAEQTERDTEGYKLMLDQLTVAGQATGVSTNQLLDTVSKNSARWQAGGGDVEGLMAHVVELAGEFGPTGLRGAMSETMAEVDTGVLPTIRTLGDQLGDTTGAVERTFEASYTWRDAISEVKNATVAYLGPAGDMLAGVGGLAVGVATMGPHLATMASKTGLVGVAQKALNLVMSLNPIGLVIAAVGALVAVYVIWQDQINAFLKGAWNAFLGAVEGGINLLRPLAGLIGVELPANLDSYKFSVDESAGSTTDAAAEIAVLKAEAEATAPVMSGTLAPAVETVTEEIEAFDLAAVKLTGQLQQHTKPAIKDIGDMLEVSGLQAGAAVVPWGFFADEVSTDVPNAMDIVMDSIMEVPPTAEEAAAQLRVIAPTWGQTLLDGLGSTFSAENVGATFSRAFEGGGGALGAIQSLAMQARTVLTQGFATALDTLVPGLGRVAGPLIAGAEALGRKIGEKIWSMFGGASEEVQQARGDLDLFASDVESRVGQTQSSTARMQDFIANGWERNRATVITFFQDQALAAGKSASDGTAHWLEYQAAMEAGNAELMGDLEQQALDWNDVNATAAEEQAAVWAETYTAETVASTTMTDEAIANSARLKEAVVADTVELSAGWKTMVDGMQAAWEGATSRMRTRWGEAMASVRNHASAMAASVTASVMGIPDRTVTITTTHRTVGGGPRSEA